MAQQSDASLGRTYECDIIVCAEDEGGFSAHVEQLAGVVSEGETIAEAVTNVTEALTGVLAAYLESEMPIPWRADAADMFAEMKVAAKRRIAFNV